MKIELTRGFYTSENQQSDIGYRKWVDEAGTPKAIFQIVHGMAEHIDRYDHFARFLAENGFAVFGNNHIGHGDSAVFDEELGHIPGKEGYLHMTKDARKLSRIAREAYPGIPLILFGHSMGSFIARYYAELWGTEIDALILCGTSGKNPLTSIGLGLIKTMSLVRGDHYRSKFIDNMAFGSYNDSYEAKKTKFDWLSQNEDNVNAYIEDNRCGQVFTLAGFRNLMTLLKTVTRDGWAATIRKDLPILLISGKEDPVGGFTKGVTDTANRLHSAGVKTVDVHLYNEMRHEILNEEARETVYNDVLEWANGHLK